MTKKFSILSIVVVLLMSVCFVGCGDSSLSKSDGIIGTWTLYSCKEDGVFQQTSGKKTYTFNDETMTITSKTGKTSTYYYILDNDKIYYAHEKYQLEDLSSINNTSIFTITSLDSEELHLFQDRSGMYGGNYGQKSHYESHTDELFLKRD